MITFAMVEALAPAVSFGEVSVRWPMDKVAEWSVLEGETMMQLLHGSIPTNFNFSRLTSLTTILATSASPVTWDLSTVMTSLMYLGLDGHDMSDEAQMELIFEGFPNLSYFECSSCVWPLTSPGYVDVVLPSSFAALVMRNPLGAGAGGKFRISSLNSGTQYLQFFDFPTTNIEIVNVPGLSKIVMENCADVPSGLEKLTDLADLSLLSIQNTSWPSGVTDWSNFSLGVLDIQGSFTSADLDRILCSIVPDSLVQLTIRDPHSTDTLELPMCVQAWPTLTKLSIKANFQFFAHLLFPLIPPTTNTLIFDRAFHIPVSFTSSWITDLNVIRELEISNNAMTGSLPDMIFGTKNTLEVLRLTNNSMEGAVPYQSMNQVVELKLDGNLFSSWPSFPESLLALTIVNLDRNQLYEIPSDDVMWRMTSLQRFSVNDNPSLQGPIPSFWANHSSLTSIRMARCEFSGTIPSDITNSKLIEMDLSSNRNIYGNLPSTPVWITKLNDNKLSGGIPVTWGEVEYPVWEVQLQNNQFNGTIYPYWLSSRTSAHASLINLSNSTWDGNMFDLRRITKNLKLEMRDTQIEFCSSSPNPDFTHIPSDSEQPGVCFFDNGAVCGCLASYASCGEGSEMTCIPEEPSQPPTPSFNPIPSNPSSQPSPPSCSGVVLPDGFTCQSNGQVEAAGSVSTGQLEMPKNLGTVLVHGNLSISTSLVLNGAATKIVVDGCITVPEGVIIKFSREEMDEAAKSGKNPTLPSPIPTDPQTLLTQRENCPNSLANVKVAVETPKSSCRKVKGDSSQSTLSSLTVAFKLDSSGCNTKWIILGSVLGGVIVIGAIVTLLLLKFNSGFRSKVLPYYGAN
jgi:hypothetical protein